MTYDDLEGYDEPVCYDEAGALAALLVKLTLKINAPTPGWPPSPRSDWKWNANGKRTN